MTVRCVDVRVGLGGTSGGKGVLQYCSTEEYQRNLRIIYIDLTAKYEALGKKIKRDIHWTLRE